MCCKHTLQYIQPFAELHNILGKKLMTLRWAEWYQRRGKERARKCIAFISNLFAFTKKLLGYKRSNNLMCSAAETNSFLHNTLSDLEKDHELGPQRALINSQAPTMDFVVRKPNWTVVHELVNGARTASAPGLSGVLYIVLKRCLQLL